MKCDSPFNWGSSSRDPALIQIPIEMDRMCFISSEMTVSPLGKHLPVNVAQFCDHKSIVRQSGRC